ncbi:hypothetical protein ACROYT_G030121 [Oculina patagonica]
MLRGHIFKKITGVSLSGLCLVDCYQDVRCQSLNYVISQYMCELNNRTKEARPEDYVPDQDRLYFRRDMNRDNPHSTDSQSLALHRLREHPNEAIVKEG